MNDREYIFGSVFVMSNRLQALGDRLDAQITMKQWLLIAIISKCENGIKTPHHMQAIWLIVRM